MLAMALSPAIHLGRGSVFYKHYLLSVLSDEHSFSVVCIFEISKQTEPYYEILCCFIVNDHLSYLPIKNVM